jgi:hypothetical protein
VIACIVLYRTYWFIVVPIGMDTMPAIYPPGTVCVIARNPSVVATGDVVFLEVQAGKTPLLARVRRVAGDQVYIAIDNRASPFVGYVGQSYPRSSVQAVVKSKFESSPDEAARDLPGEMHGK